MNKSEEDNRPGQGTSAGYEITDGHCVSPLRNPAKRKYLQEDRRVGGETNYTTTGRMSSGTGERPTTGHCGCTVMVMSYYTIFYITGNVNSHHRPSAILKRPLKFSFLSYGNNVYIYMDDLTIALKANKS